MASLGLPPNPKVAAEILRDIETYLLMPQEQKAQIAVRDDGDADEDDENS